MEPVFERFGAKQSGSVFRQEPLKNALFGVTDDRRNDFFHEHFAAASERRFEARLVRSPIESEMEHSLFAGLGGRPIRALPIRGCKFWLGLEGMLDEPVMISGVY